MAISGIPTTGGDDTVTVTPTGYYSVDGGAGTDILTLNYGTLSTNLVFRDVGYGWQQFSDDFRTGTSFINFERFFVTGGSGDDVLAGRDNADRLIGGAGSDQITSGLGADTIDGGSGVDRWTASYGSLLSAVNLTLLAVGTATVTASGAQVTGIEALTMTTGIGDDNINTSAFGYNDVIITGDGNDSVNLGRGMDSANGGVGTDTLIMDWSAISDPNGGIGLSNIGYGWMRYASDSGDRLDYYSFEVFDLTGGAGDDALSGAGGDDHLTGNGGDDLLNGAGGADTVAGGAGVDIWQVNISANLAPATVDLLTQTTNFGAVISGIERLNFTGTAADDTVTLLAGSYDDVVSTGLGNDTITTGRGIDNVNGGGDTDLLIMDWSAITDSTQLIAWSNQGYGWSRYASISGDQVDYYSIERFDLTGGAGSDTLIGGGLADTLRGGAGDDYLNSGAGDAVIEGGAGTDLWQADFSANGVGAVINLQTQSVNAGATISGIERLNFTGTAVADYIYLRTAAFNDSVSTGLGDDTIVSGRGADVINGGGGTDLLIMNWSVIGDPTRAIGWSDQGYGWSRYSASTGDMVDYIGIERFNLTGGAGNDTLSGGTLADTLIGGGGNDYLNSGTGAARINGGAGIDTWVADFSGSAASLYFNALTSQTGAQGGAVGSWVRNIEAVNLTGGLGRDVISTAGYALNDVMNGGAGNDSFATGLGHDQVNGGAGTDLLILDYSASSHQVYARDIGYGWGRYAELGDANYTDYYAVERFNITGGSGNDRLTGAGSLDTLSGGAGNDILNGGGGNDRIYGGVGNDTWISDHGTRTNVLNLTLNGAGNGSLAGMGTVVRSIENVNITTGLNNDRVNLAALSGDDTISTGAGDDIIQVGRGHLESVNGGAGSDWLIAVASLATSGVSVYDIGYGWTTMRAADGSYSCDWYSIERLNLTGSSRGDRLMGGGGDDRLVGGGGSDYLAGGGGNDTLVGGAGTDVFVFNAPWSDGVDLISGAETGEIIRLAGVGFTGSVTAGNGGLLVAGQIDVSSSGGMTTLYVGLDGTAGADFSVTLSGTFGVGDFSALGTDIFLI